jgi:curved DNA-binding protein CbpA
MKYFQPIPTTAEELKKAYRKLALKHHPDSGGTDEAMKQVNAEYEKLFQKVGNIHTNAKGETYQKDTGETPEEFINIINILVKMEGITIEIIGRFIWVEGNTKPYKDQLKEMKFRWHSKKVRWYLAPEDYVKRSRKDYSMDDLREMYGSQEVETRSANKLAGRV